VDFIETLFGIAPDGGDGSLEILWLGAIIVAALAFVFRRRITARLLSRTSSPR
jgi:LPXTG-motif cell wall-anchored protein